MSQPVIKYQSAQGGIFNSQAEADASEKECALVDGIMAPIGPRPILADYPKPQFFQHDPKVVLAARVALVDHLRKGPLLWFFKDRTEPSADWHPNGLLGRVTSEDGGWASRAFGRFGQIDDKGREWSQNYYALHETEGERVLA